jgi:hypothetical protein
MPKVDIRIALAYGRSALVITEGRTALQLENLTLRHQIGVFQRPAKRAPGIAQLRTLVLGRAIAATE